jgi:hypothetical protein
MVGKVRFEARIQEPVENLPDPAELVDNTTTSVAQANHATRFAARSTRKLYHESAHSPLGRLAIGLGMFVLPARHFLFAPNWIDWVAFPEPSVYCDILVKAPPLVLPHFYVD